MAESRRNIFKLIQFPVYLVAILWVVHILKVSGILNYRSFGLMPRETSGIVGIFTSPFIHGNFQHLISNSVPLFVMTFIIVFFYRRIAYQSMLLIYVLTGLAVWAFARANVIHIGASGVVYGLVSFVFWTGIFRRNVKSIILALVIMMLYSGLFLGVLPNQPGISWESHLFGGLVGILIAFVMKDAQEADEEPTDPWKDEQPSSDYFLPRDAFEETLMERAQRRQIEQRQAEQRQRDQNQSRDWTSDAT